MWVARFQHHDVIRQYESDKEILFKEVLDCADDLASLTITFADVSCSVDFSTGLFTVTKDGVSLIINGLDSDKCDEFKDLQYRPIYFQRHIQFLNIPSANSILFTAIGWQANKTDGVNIKRILKIYENNYIEVVTE